MQTLTRYSSAVVLAGAFTLTASFANAQDQYCAFDTSIGFLQISAGEGVSFRAEGEAGAPLYSINGLDTTVYYEPQPSGTAEIYSVSTAPGITGGVANLDNTFIEGNGEHTFASSGPYTGVYCLQY